MGAPLGGPAIAPDGQRLAFLVQRRGRTQLYVMNADGTGARRVAAELDVRGAPAWSPDGQWLAVAANRDGEPQLFKIPVGGGTPVPLVKEYSIDPIWAPSGQFLVYSGADVGTTFSVKAVNADGDASPTAEPDSDPWRQAPGLSRRRRCAGRPERRRLAQGVLARRSRDRPRAATDQSRSRVRHRRLRRLCGRPRNHLRSGTRRVGYRPVRPARSMTWWQRAAVACAPRRACGTQRSTFAR